MNSTEKRPRPAEAAVPPKPVPEGITEVLEAQASLKGALKILGEARVKLETQRNNLEEKLVLLDDADVKLDDAVRSERAVTASTNRTTEASIRGDTALNSFESAMRDYFTAEFATIAARRRLLLAERNALTERTKERGARYFSGKAGPYLG